MREREAVISVVEAILAARAEVEEQLGALAERADVGKVVPLKRPDQDSSTDEQWRAARTELGGTVQQQRDRTGIDLTEAERPDPPSPDDDNQDT